MSPGGIDGDGMERVRGAWRKTEATVPQRSFSDKPSPGTQVIQPRTRIGFPIREVFTTESTDRTEGVGWRRHRPRIRSPLEVILKPQGGSGGAEPIHARIPSHLLCAPCALCGETNAAGPSRSVEFQGLGHGGDGFPGKARADAGQPRAGGRNPFRIPGKAGFPSSRGRVESGRGGRKTGWIRRSGNAANRVMGTPS